MKVTAQLVAVAKYDYERHFHSWKAYGVKWVESQEDYFEGD